MNTFLQENMISLGLGLILSSLALFCAFKSGQVLERKVTLESIHDVTLNKLKQKTGYKLEMLLNEYKETDSNINVPKDINIKDMVDCFVNIDQTIPEKILALNQIYLDLVYNNTNSVYFAEVLHYLM